MTIKFKAESLFIGVQNPDYESLIGKPITLMNSKVGIIKEYSNGEYSAEIWNKDDIKKINRIIEY